jgi:glycine/D-amino acid oxidase-like deaminating enzyme
MTSQFSSPQTYYSVTRNRQLDCPPLEGQAQADVCIVGAGFTGLNTAIELAERGHSVIVLEAHQIAWGATGRNGGQLIRGIGHDLGAHEKSIGSEGVQVLEQLGLEAVELVRQRVQQHGIQCDLRWGHCELANTPRHYENLLAEQEALARLGYPHKVELVEQPDMHRVVGSDRYVGGLIDEGSGHLHPLNLALGEAALAQRLGVRLCEKSAAIRIDYGRRIRVHTANGVVHARTLVLAGNAHLGDLEPALSGKVLAAGSYVVATEPLSEALAQTLIPANRALCDQRVGLDYYRLSADRRLLFGGACHYSGRTLKDIAGYMRPKMLEVFPQLAAKRIDFQWSGMIGIGANRLPQIGRLQAQPNVFYAQAYAGHGINTTHMAARLLAEAISLEHSQGFDLFASVPHMTFPGGKLLRSPLLALGMCWYRLKEIAGH